MSLSCVLVVETTIGHPDPNHVRAALQDCSEYPGCLRLQRAAMALGRREPAHCKVLFWPIAGMRFRISPLSELWNSKVATELWRGEATAPTITTAAGDLIAGLRGP